MNGVIASQTELLGHRPGTSHESLRHFDDVELGMEDLELFCGGAKFQAINSVHAKRHGQCGPPFGIDQPR